MLVPCWNVERLPVFEGSRRQIGIAEGGASFPGNATGSDRRWLPRPSTVTSGPDSEVDFKGLERNNMSVISTIGSS
jgi:hypothetical protein